MDKSVWYEEVDTALLELISSTISIDGNPINSFVRNPENIFKDDESVLYPCVSIYNLYSKPSKTRDNPNIEFVEVSKSGGSVVLERKAIPYTLTYQVDFWSRFKEEMNEMTKQWLYMFSTYFNLKVLDASGNDSDCFVRAKDTVRSIDDFSSEGNIYHSVQTLTIEVAIDYGVQTTEKTVTDIRISYSKEI